ncbi:VPLPA-CTERM sorting domain-containing protein [Pacificoceanicola onchidii]|uniref:VPLPA-CTERM sorting domain-containing protein n=1 Tax=Pacificoceanicola onchidii TaxID=2562685 RepID=UPI0010A2EF84|nr:VPLPA-CTERM sorting domain-containing protein [Pacificoceanicola onchidii]
MSLKSLFAAALLTALSSAPAQALHHSLNDWWLTTDSFGGLKQSEYDPTFYFAVSKSTTWNPADTYEIMPGYRWATTQEILDAFVPSVANSKLYNYNYYSQGGWAGYTWEGHRRYFFRASDSAATDHFLHAGQFSFYEGGTSSSTTNFAGLVLIETAAVPLPGALGLMLAGLGGLGLARRKRKS